MCEVDLLVRCQTGRTDGGSEMTSDVKHLMYVYALSLCILQRKRFCAVVHLQVHFFKSCVLNCLCAVFLFCFNILLQIFKSSRADLQVSTIIHETDVKQRQRQTYIHASCKRVNIAID